MINVTVYDTTSQELERLSDKLDTTIAEIIEMLVDNYAEDLIDDLK